MLFVRSLNGGSVGPASGELVPISQGRPKEEPPKISLRVQDVGRVWEASSIEDQAAQLREQISRRRIPNQVPNLSSHAGTLEKRRRVGLRE
jgi:hypothetical protein